MRDLYIRLNQHKITISSPYVRHCKSFINDKNHGVDGILHNILQCDNNIYDLVDENNDKNEIKRGKKENKPASVLSLCSGCQHLSLIRL